MSVRSVFVEVMCIYMVWVTKNAQDMEHHGCLREVKMGCQGRDYKIIPENNM